MSESERLCIDHPRFGRLEIPESDVLHFDGLPGFPEARRFALLGHDRDGVLGWLVSLDDLALAFVVTDPWQFFPDYAPDLGEATLASLGARGREDVEVLALVSLREGRPSLNLLAPLLLCAPTRRGTQCIVEDDRLSTCQLLPALVPPAVKPGSESPRVGPDQKESKPQR